MPTTPQFPSASPVSDEYLLLVWNTTSQTQQQATIAAVFAAAVSGVSKFVNSIADLRDLDPADFDSGQQILVGGYYSDGDGGGGIFYGDPDSGEADNGGTIIAPTAGTGRWIRLYDGQVSVSWFGALGDGTADDEPAITAAFSVSTNVFVPGNKTYGVGAVVRVPANGQFFSDGNCTITALPGFTANYIIELATDSQLTNINFDGTNMPAPSGAWVGVGSPVGSCIYIPGSSGEPVLRAQIRDCKFSNFPSGPLFARYAHDLTVSDCKALSCQTYGAAETNACFETYESQRVMFENLEGSTFNWKCYNVGNSVGSQLIGCKANGGSAGMASHYLSGCDGCTIIGGFQTGGFGVKIFNSQRISIQAFSSHLSSGSAIYLQAVQDFSVSGCVIRRPAAKGVIIEGLNGYGPAERGVVSSCVIDYVSAAVSIAQVGVYVSADAGSFVDDVSIVDTKIHGAYFGIQVPNVATVSVSRLRVSGCTISSPVQYGVIAHVKSAIFSENEVTMDAAFPAFFCACATSTVGESLRFIGNSTENANVAGNHFEIAAGGGLVKYDLLEFRGNRGRLGSQFAILSLNNSATDYVLSFVFDDNEGFDLTSASAVQITFNATTAVFSCSICGNSLPTAAGGFRNIALSNTTQLTSAVMEGNRVNDLTNRPRNAYPFQGTGSPEGVVTAAVGSQYFRTDGGAGTTLYIKEAGTGNTGWAAK